ncbi:MAG: TIGR02996 domain-containing protein [Kofleriaceae bacterium]
MAKAKKKKPAGQKIKLAGKDKKGQAVLVHLSVEGKKLITTTGQAWGGNKDKTKTFGTPDKAREAYDKALAGFVADGFREIGAIPDPAIPIARDAKLEAAIRANREDAGAYMIYADWLQGQGSPMGEMIAYAQRGQKKKAENLAAKIGMPDPEFATVVFEHGLWKSLRINNDIDNMDDEWDPLPPIERLFASPLCAVLDELRIGMVRWEHYDQPAVIELAGKQAWAKDLRSLAVGDVGRNIDMNHHSIGDVGKRITKVFPNLESLFLHSGSQRWRSGEGFGTSGLELPTLKRLVVETCAMTAKRLKGFFGGLPNATFVELWFGDPDRDEPLARAGDLMPVFTGAAFPKVTHLGLCNTKLVTEIVRFLPTTKIAKQLTELDLSRGTFWDEDATELAAEAKAFPKLELLDVSRSWLTKAGVKTLKKAFPGVKLLVDDQEDPTNAEEDYGGRYVSVSE